MSASSCYRLHGDGGGAITQASATFRNCAVGANHQRYIIPNPTTSAFTTSAAGEAVISDVQGHLMARVLLSSGKTLYAVPSGTAAGIYFYHIRLEDGTKHTVKLVYQP